MDEGAFRKIAGTIGSWRLNPHIYLSILAIAIGFLGGYGALLFRYAIKGAQYLFYQNSDDILTFAHTLPIYLTILMPALGGLIVGPLVYLGAKETKGHGVPEVMEAVALRGGKIRRRVAAMTIISAGVTIGSGGSAGREDPIVQIGSSIGSTVAQILKVPPLRRRTLVGCGAAAGIAATFNAPIAGVLYAVEVILGDIGLATFSPLVLSSVTATTISRHYFGDFPAFIIPPYKLVSLWEFLFYPLLGVAAGLIALLFIVTLYKSEDLFESLKIPGYLKPALGGLMVGCLLVVWPQVFGVGYGAMNQSLLNEIPVMVVFSLIFIKILATSITLGSGGSGGGFAPSLFMGGMLGCFFGWGVHSLYPHITGDPGAYALVAMGAVVAATTHAPITAIIIIFEMSATYEIILPLMTACIISTIISTSLKSGSIYTTKLIRRGVDIGKSWEQGILQNIRVRDIMSSKVNTIPESMPLLKVMEHLKNEHISYLHVVDRNDKLSGIVSFRDIRPGLREELLDQLVIAKDLATINPVTVRPSDNILHVLQVMSGRGISQLPVVADDDSGKVIGTISQRDVVAAYDKAVLNREECGGSPNFNPSCSVDPKR
jgi:CIC family chloride channel protein